MRDLEEFPGGSAPPSGPSSATTWWSGDPEAKSRRRVVAYKAYAVEARVKASLRRGFRWIKDRIVRRR
ncbi:hypothetical protein GUJ93_ZPchr0003g17957 [Zizania palustris]|uniref:DUF3511 domain-containing protein n=1 Tax=Zizania palustris TaxID=103762 RepID=A0A8J5S826_ZIZPA|nr:hypothetical protein GUJ93_ZPchr0003g17957 [Zizania palustris]